MDHFPIKREEQLSSISHGLGLVFALGALPVLIGQAITRGDTWHVVGCAIFGTCMIAMMGASTLYHGVTHPGRKQALRVVDHISIFLLIAGGYTPFCLTTLRDTGGTALLAILWGLALLGIAFKLRYTGRFEPLSLLLYLAMGWMGVIAIEPIMQHMRAGTLTLILFAATAFTVGVVFYAMDHRRGFHFAWHLFVIAGCLCLYGAVFHELPPVQ